MAGIPTVARSATLKMMEDIFFSLTKLSKAYLVFEIKKREKQVHRATAKTNNKNGAPEWKYECPAELTAREFLTARELKRRGKGW